MSCFLTNNNGAMRAGNIIGGTADDDFSGANDIFDRLQEKQKQAMDQLTKKTLPTDEDFEVVYQLADFELHYQRPKDFVVLTRQPWAKNLNEWDEYILKNVQHTHLSVTEYDEFAKMMKKKVADGIKSKLLFHCTLAVSRSGLKQAGSSNTVTTLEQLYKLWTTTTPTVEMARTIFDVFFGMFEKDDCLLVKKIQFEVMRENKIWFGDNDISLNRYPNGMVRKSTIWQTIHDKLRDLFRNKYTRSHGVPHGIKIGVTIKEREKRSRRKKGEFIFEENVTGWDGEKHKEHLFRLAADSGHLFSHMPCDLESNASRIASYQVNFVCCRLCDYLQKQF